MFIQCSDCDFKYIVNSADLKPDGRIVECANCNHRWFQEPLKEDDLLLSSVPKNPKQKNQNKEQLDPIDENILTSKEIKNLPSTLVKEKKVSYINTFLVIFALVTVVLLFWILKSYGTNIFVLINFYFNEFFFNLKLIIEDLAKIVYQILN
tara:strand:- start:2486 stop:2938 length:453 start_codon:yes stop_codon:yes gene_type:complete